MPEKLFLKKKVAILGGGISGIAAALFLHEQDESIHIDLFEQSKRLGGWIDSLSGEFPFELGPRTLVFERSPHIVKLLQILKLDQEILFSKAPSTRYLCKNTTLLALPPDLKSILKDPLLYASLFKALLLDYFVSSQDGDETIDQFFRRRFGETIGSVFGSMLAKGVFGGDSQQLSINACFPKLKKLEQEGPLLKGMFRKKKSGKRGLFTLEKGLQSIFERFEAKSSSPIYYEHHVTSIEKKEEQLIVHGIRDHQEPFQEGYDAVISALPPKAFETLLTSSSVISLEKSLFLRDLSLQSLTLVCVGFRKRYHVPEGFGFLTTGNTLDPLLGCVFESELFPDVVNKTTRLTFMLKGVIDDEHAQSRVQKALVEILKIEMEPDFIHVQRSVDCIPQYPLHHQMRWDALMDELSMEKLFSCGTGGGGVSLEDCARKGFDAAEQVVHSLNEISIQSNKVSNQNHGCLV